MKSRDPDQVQKDQEKESAYRRLMENRDYLEYIVKPAKESAKRALDQAVTLAVKKDAPQADPVYQGNIIALIREYHFQETEASKVADYLAALESNRARKEAGRLKTSQQ